MIKRRYALILFLLTASAAWAKGPIVEIEITGDGIAAPLRIKDAAVLDRFSIWNGPGVSSSTAGVKDAPAYLNPDAHDGRFIDWPRGFAAQRPAGLQRFEVTFHLATPRAESQYVVAYEIDPRKNKGYIYLPRWTNDVISQGVEGHWFYASRQWDELVMPLVVRRMSGAQSSFRCSVGTARISDDGTIAVRLIINGRRSSQFVYAPSDSEYADVKRDIGEIAPGADVPVSCWPHRT